MPGQASRFELLPPTPHQRMRSFRGEVAPDFRVLLIDVGPAGGDRREYEPRHRDVATIICGVLLPAAVEALELRKLAPGRSQR